MKKLLLIFIFTLSFQSLSKADDIRDFEIEGMSIGDSALDYFSEKEILSVKQNTQYPNDKFIIYQLESIKLLKTYSALNVSIKKNDKKYVISHMQAIIYYNDAKDFLKCNPQQKIIVSELTKLFSNSKIEDTKYLSSFDKKSPIEGTEIYLNNGAVIAINCNDWLKQSTLTKNLDVGLASREFHKFILEEAFN